MYHDPAPALSLLVLLSYAFLPDAITPPPLLRVPGLWVWAEWGPHGTCCLACCQPATHAVTRRTPFMRNLIMSSNLGVVASPPFRAPHFVHVMQESSSARPNHVPSHHAPANSSEPSA
jgi:hypothetical protein